MAYLCIRRAESNVQFRNRNTGIREIRKIACVNTAAGKTSHGNGEPPSRSAARVTRPHGHMEKKAWPRRTRPADEATRISPDGKKRKQVGHIAISQKYSNFVRKTHEVHNPGDVPKLKRNPDFISKEITCYNIAKKRESIYNTTLNMQENNQNS